MESRVDIENIVVAKIGSGSPQENSTRSPESLRLIRTWLSKCRQEHHQCSRGADTLPSQPPTRLIEILNDKIRLYIPKEEEAVEYATLSHRWPIKLEGLMLLTDDAIGRFQDKIEEDDPGFSRVFANAVFLCRELGIRFLWIDCLCIIQQQSDRSDWGREHQKMGAVYKNALLNFAATDSYAENPLIKGIFRNRKPEHLQPNEVEASFNSIFRGSWYDLPGRLFRISTFQSAQSGKYHVISGNLFSRSVYLAPLNKRGWVIQERLLSPRIVHFTHDQLFWECNSVIACETYPKGLPDVSLSNIPPAKALLTNIDRVAVGQRRPTSFPSGISDLVKNPYFGWHELVTVYSRGDLTQKKDKLIAISGMARTMRNAIPKDRYCAGIWSGDIERGILWQTHFYRKTEPIRPRSPSPYQAPSWSWASVNWQVHHNDKLHAEKYDILVSIKEEDIHVDPATARSNDEYGALKGGSLSLTGTTYPIDLQWMDAIDGDNILRPMYFRWVWIGGLEFSKRWRECILPDDPYCPSSSAGLLNARQRSDLRLLPVLQSKARGKEAWLQCLILEPTGKNADEYQRWGIIDALFFDVGGLEFWSRAASPKDKSASVPKRGFLTII